MKDYYKSKHWKNFRKSLTEPIDAECEICHRKKWTTYKRNTKKYKKGDKRRLLVLVVHHLHYETLGNEERSDVLVLCRRCHNLLHDIERASHQAPFDQIYTYIKSITKWDYQKRKK